MYCVILVAFIYLYIYIFQHGIVSTKNTSTVTKDTVGPPSPHNICYLLWTVKSVMKHVKPTPILYIYIYIYIYKDSGQRIAHIGSLSDTLNLIFRGIFYDIFCSPW